MQPEMFTTLGEIVIHWSRVESSIDQEIFTMRHQWEIVRKLTDVLPHAFSPKLKLWRDSVRTLYPTIEDYQLFADAFVERVKNAARIRNHLIHGMWSLPENEVGEFHIVSYHKGRVAALWVGQPLLDDLLEEVKNLVGLILGFTITKMMHAHTGQLAARPSSTPDHHTHPSPATPEKPQEPPSSSEG